VAANFWYDPAKIAAAMAAQGVGTNGSMLSGQNLLGILNTLQGAKAYSSDNGGMAQTSGYKVGNDTLDGGIEALLGRAGDKGVQPVMLPDTWNPTGSGESYDAGYTPGRIDQAATAKATAEYRKMLLARAGLDPNKQYAYANRAFDTPGGNGGKDKATILYEIGADGSAKPVSAHNQYEGSWWTDIGRDFTKSAAAMALGAYGAGTAISAAGMGSAGSAAGAGLADAAPTAADIGSQIAAENAGYASSIGAGQPSLLQSAGSAALKGAAINGGMTAVRGGSLSDVLKSAAIGGVTGGVGGAVGAYNPTGSLGITDPTLQSIGNKAISGGINAGLTGGNVGSGIIGGAVGGATGAATGYVSGATGLPSGLVGAGLGAAASAGLGSLTNSGGKMADNQTVTDAASVDPTVAQQFQQSTGMSVSDAIAAGGTALVQLSAMAAAAKQYGVANSGIAASQAAGVASSKVAADSAAAAQQQRDLYQQTVAPATQQIGLSALGAQNLSAAQVTQLQQLQQTIASPTASPAAKAAAQAQLQVMQKTAEANGIGLENAKADLINKTAAGQGAAATALGETDAQARLANGNTSASVLNAAGDARRADQTGFYDSMAQTLRDTAKQRAADFEARQTTRGNADIETSASDAQRQLLRLGGDPNRMAAMSGDIANQQQLARISNGNQIGATNIANLNAADDQGRALQTTGFNAGTAQQYGLQDQAMSVKSSALDAARATRTAAAQTAQGIVNAGQNAGVGITNGAKDKVNASTTALQTTAAGLGPGLSNSATGAAALTNGSTNAINSGVYAQGTMAGETAKAIGSITGAGSTIANPSGTGFVGLANTIGNLFHTNPSAATGVPGFSGLPSYAITNPSAGTANPGYTLYKDGVGANTTGGAYHDATYDGTGSYAAPAEDFVDYSDYASSKKTKENFKSVSGDKVLDGLSSVVPKAYDYKPGEGDGRSHIGPMAEDMHRNFGDTVAPGGKKINAQSELGLHHVAINALTKRVKQLEKRK
jgi:hypothetical protein